MTVNKFRSENASMEEGATDGKYRKRRPNTAVSYTHLTLPTNREV